MLIYIRHEELNLGAAKLQPTGPSLVNPALTAVKVAFPLTLNSNLDLI